MFHYMRECDEMEALHYLTLTPYVTLRKEKEINYTPIGMYWMQRWGGESTHQAMVQTRRPEKSRSAWQPGCLRWEGNMVISKDRFMCAVPKHPFHRPIYVRRAEAPISNPRKNRTPHW